MVDEKQSNKWKLAFIAIGLVGFVALIFFNRGTLKETWELLQEVDIRIALLLPLTQFLSYFFIANYYKSFLHSFGKSLHLLHAWGIVFALQFVNQVLPSGGVSGLSYFAYSLRNVAPVGTVSLAQLGRYILSYLSYAFVLSSAVVFLIVGGDMNLLLFTVAAVLITTSLIGGALFWWVINSKKNIDKFVRFVSGLINRVVGLFQSIKRPVLDEKKVKETLIDFHDGVHQIRSNIKDFSKHFMFMIFSTACEVSIVYLAFVALGQTVNPGIILISLAAANAVGVISVVPGDIGFHEAAMIFMLNAAGVDSAVAVSATLLYRVFNKMAVLPFGFFFYTKYLKPVRQHQAKHG